MVSTEIGAGDGHTFLRIELGALGIKHGLEVDQPAVIAQATPRCATSASSTSVSAVSTAAS